MTIPGWRAASMGAETQLHLLRLNLLHTTIAHEWELRVYLRAPVTIGARDHRSELGRIRFPAPDFEAAKGLAISECNAWLEREIDRLLLLPEAPPKEDP